MKSIVIIQRNLCYWYFKRCHCFHADLVREINVPVSFDFMAAFSYGKGSTSSGAVKILKD